MRLSIRHRTRLDYNHDVIESVMDARLGPLSDAHQRWERHEILLAPAGAIRLYVDGFGNHAALLTVPRPHRYVEITALGVVETLLADPFVPRRVPPRPLSPAEQFDYLRSSHLVALPDGVHDLASPYRPKTPDDIFEAVREMMGLVYREFTYRKDVTTISTTVAELLETRTGVCQDFAHILIAMCRVIGIPARYVSGYIVSRTAPAQPPMPGQSQSQSQTSSATKSQAQSQTQRQSGSDAKSLGTMAEPPQGPSRGAGASHAWVEVYTPTHGWRGYDPTNNLVASESHIKMAIGRDYGDIPPTRGTFRGSAEEQLVVEVSVVPQDETRE